MRFCSVALGISLFSLTAISRSPAQSTAFDAPPTVTPGAPTPSASPSETNPVLESLAPIENNEIAFEDGLKLELPAGWRTTILETKAATPATGTAADAAKPITLLLHALPKEDRNASISILRDINTTGESDAAAKQKALARLTEIAAEQGFKVERLSNKGRVDSPNNIIFSEVYGVAGDARRRIFTCVTLNRAQRPAIRCYWQCDESDTVSRRQFDDLINLMACDGVTVADVLWSGAMMGEPTSPAIVQQASVGKEGTPTTAATTTAASTVASGTLTPQSADLVAKYRDSLVVIEGDNGKGSGFICKMDEQPWMMTNIHVMADNPKPRFTTMNGKSLTLGAAYLGVDHDIFRGALADSTNMLEVMKDIDVNAKIGDAIVVLGNPEGAGVIKPIEGKIVGIGPNLVEVDAPFVPGNSGSPIVHVASGKVVGIATYALIRKIDKDKNGVETIIRRFGYRLDNVTKWEPLNWPAFYAQSSQSSKIESTSAEFIELFKDAKESKMRSSNYENPGIQRALLNYERATRGSTRMSASDQAASTRQLVGELRIAAVADINAFDNRVAYDYFRRTVAGEKKFRDELYAHFTRFLENNR